MTLTGAGSLFTGSMIDLISKGDHALMRRIHHWDGPRWLRLFLVAATRGGDGWMWYVLGFLIVAFGDHSRFAAVGAGTSASATGIAIYQVVKKKTRRRRPCLVEPNPWAHLPPPDQYSFPSGHTIGAFSVAVSVGLFYPSLMGLLLSFALIVAISRIMLGMHFLSDVLVGALIGISLGYGAVELFK